MISRQVMTVSATISAKVAGDVGRLYASFLSVNAKVFYTIFYWYDCIKAVFLY